LLDAMNGGVALASYIGHSGPTLWSFQGLFTSGDAQALANAGKPMVVAQWGCWTTYYVTPSVNTLGHKLMLSGPQGAAAVLGATTLTKSSSEEKLGQLMMPLLTQPGMTLGDAMQAAKMQMAATQPELADVLLGWTLLGDPTLVVQR
jgi:hypothetical protein